MNTKKIAAYGIGIMSTMVAVTGLLLLLPVQTVAVVTAIVVICLSLASGILLPNPVSFVGLTVGILALVFPSGIVGGILVTTGVVAAILNGIFARKQVTG